MKVLFAIGQDTSNSVQNNVLEEFQKKFNKIFTYKSEYYIDGVLKCLREEKFDVLVLNEELEKVAVDMGVIDTITDLYPDLQVILGISDKHKESEYINRLYALGVYDALYFSDFKVDNLIDLLNCNRTKKQAKDYYCIDEKMDDIEIKFQVTPISEEELTKTISSLEQSLNDGNLNGIFKQVDKEYNTKEMCYLLTMLPNKISEALINSKDKVYTKYQKIVQKEINKIETRKEAAKEVKTQIKYIEKIKEVPKIQKVEVIKEVPVVEEKIKIIEKEVTRDIEVLSDSVITLLSNSPTGKSFLGWNLAHAFAKQGYNTALINTDLCNSSNFFFGIEDDEPVLENITSKNKNLQDLVNGGYVINDNLVIYTGEFGKASCINKEVFSKLLGKLRADNDIVIIDPSSGLNENLMIALQYSNINIVVSDLDYSHLEMNLRFLDNISTLINRNKTIGVINNIQEGSKKIKEVEKVLKEKNFFKEIIKIRNAGPTSYDYINTDTCNYLEGDSKFTEDFKVLLDILRVRNYKPMKKQSIFHKIFKK